MELKPPQNAIHSPSNSTFNRTTMELKRVLYDYLGSPRLLLIEPLWNWNCPMPLWCPSARLLLIEPLWNWNRSPLQHLTAVALLLIEPLWNWNAEGTMFVRVGGKLLIEPLWNWNVPCFDIQYHWWQPFNRTTMELKLCYPIHCVVDELPFNRTTMELKLKGGERHGRTCGTFNRTTMELKQYELRERSVRISHF